MCIAVKLTANVEIQISVPIVNIHSVLCWTVLTYKATHMTKTKTIFEYLLQKVSVYLLKLSYR